MTGMTDLQTLLASMSPRLDPHTYVFVTTTKPQPAWLAQAKGSFVEAEGTTLILAEHDATAFGFDTALGFDKDTRFACISLDVHSSLEAVGLTAAFATALAQANISANVVAGYYHDHIFVAKVDADSAIKVLRQLSEQAQSYLA